MSDKKNLSPETKVVQANHAVDPATGGVVPPIQPSTTYSRDENYQLIHDGMDYSRDKNPTYLHAEEVLADLEGGVEALLFSSGMAGISSLIRTLDRGDHIAAPARMYHGVIGWLKAFTAKRDIDISFYDPVNPNELARSLIAEKTKLVWVETPANPTWEVTDIKAAADLAHSAGAELAVDNTVPTPVHTNPISLGADYVFHSGTKYLNGHSDVMAGVLITKEQNERWEQVRFERHYSGAILGPFEAWLLLRGMRTLFVRVRQSGGSALRIAKHFENHPKLDAVRYPGLESHPGHEVAKRQMQDGFGGMLSLLVKGDTEEAIRVANHMNVIITATSLGGVESLVEHRKSTEGPDSLTPDNLLRISVGLEKVDDVISDIEDALESI